MSSTPQLTGERPRGSSRPSRPGQAPGSVTSPLVDVVVPVHNEEAVLAGSVRRLHDHLTAELPYCWQITIADNGSTDHTGAVGAALAGDLPGVRYMHVGQQGRGLALRSAWGASTADVLCYMDVDLSTDLRALLPLLAPLVCGHSELAIGSRLAAGSRTTRGARRELISRGYNAILRVALAARFSDAQCGFKAIRRDAAMLLLPGIVDDGWFFDTELLIAAQRAGMRIHEVAVDWIDDDDSSVEVLRTALDDLRGVGRLLVAPRKASDPATRSPSAQA